MLCKSDYETQIASTRDERMDWWRQARFGMFVHYGLYSQLGRMEWAMGVENWEVGEYKKLAESFNPKPRAPREWCALAKKAGMKYVVFTTRHHEGFSLWDSKVNPFNSVNYGPKRDIVKEFVEACRKFDLKIGFYTSLMDWHHPDGTKCAYDSEARGRFTKYIRDLNTELLTQYGKIDVLWYDMAFPMESWEGWDSLSRNEYLRSLQPQIIINNRSRLDEDFGTPEGELRSEEKDWEACMTFNDISWGYVDSVQAAPFSYTPQRIVKMLNKCSGNNGNLLLNIGPKPDGSVPEEAIKPLEEVGKWLEVNGEAVYGNMTRKKHGLTSIGIAQGSQKKNKVYLWNWIWPHGGEFPIAGYSTKCTGVRILGYGNADFEQRGYRITVKIPDASPDNILGIAVFELTFEKEPEFIFMPGYGSLRGGKNYN